MIVVSDTSPISSLYLTGRLQIAVKKIFSLYSILSF